MEKLLLFLAVLTAEAYVAHCLGATQEQLNDVGLRFYTGNSYVERNVSRCTELLEYLDPSCPTYIYTHGFTESPDTSNSQLVITALQSIQCANVGALNWSQIAGEDYVDVALSGKSVGNILAQCLDQLAEANSNFDETTLTLIGFSMGAQISGYAGRATSFRVPKILACDPAGPGYNVVLEGLQSTDADFVCATHTDSGFFGTLHTVGCDFYPNGGHRIEPGCPNKFLPLSNDDFCSHARCPMYFAESVRNPEAFLGAACPDEVTYNTGACNNNAKVAMGFAVPTNTQGTFFLTTNSASEYGRGEYGSNAPPNINIA